LHSWHKVVVPTMLLPGHGRSTRVWKKYKDAA
jgi:hypothetical protein